MNLEDHRKRLQKGDYRDRCSWCFWQTAGTDRGRCDCLEFCGKGMCAADDVQFVSPPVPRFV